MLPSRYYFWLLYLNGMVSLIEFTPKLIYSKRYASSLPSLVVALLLTSAMRILFESRMKRFPGESITQIMNGVFANSLQKALMLAQVLLSYWVGLIFLVSISQILHVFASPDHATGLLYGVFLGLIVLVSLLDSKSILFMMEVVVLLQIPFSLILILIFAFDPNPHLDFMMQAATYILHLPSYPMIAAGTFIFNGYLQALVFHEHITISSRKIQQVAIMGISTVFLCAFYFIPIGYMGLAGMGEDIDVWFTTANSMNIRHFFIERFLLIFVMVQLTTTLMFVILCWHSSLQWLKQAKLTNGGNGKWVSLAVLLLVSCFCGLLVDESTIRNSLAWFLNIKLAFDLAMIGVVVWCAKQRKAR